MRVVRFDVNGLNQLKLLNTFVAENISVYELNRVNAKKMSFKVSSDCSKRAAEIMDGQGFKYETTQLKAKMIFMRAFKRLGLVIGAVAMLIIGILASGYLWKIEISGNERLDELTIVRTLEDKGISVGSRLKFDSKEVERVLMEMPDIAAVSAQIVGTTLKVDVIESTVLTPEVPEGDIVSLYDAMVTRIVVTSGSAMVKIGDKVSIGRTLIEGVEYDTDGNPLLNVNADGKVFGKVNFTYSEIASAKRTRRTGKSITKTDIIFFGKRIGKEAKADFLFETEKSLTKIGAFLPLYAENTVYYELEQYSISIEDLIDQVKDKAINTLIIKAGSSPIDVVSNYKEIAEGLYRINVHIEAEVSIGGKSG